MKMDNNGSNGRLMRQSNTAPQGLIISNNEENTMEIFESLMDLYKKRTQ
jgi:hypothetical protein